MYVESDRKLRQLVKAEDECEEKNTADIVLSECLNDGTKNASVEAVTLSPTERLCSSCEVKFDNEESFSGHENNGKPESMVKLSKPNHFKTKQTNSRKINNFNIPKWECFKCHSEWLSFQSFNAHHKACHLMDLKGNSAGNHVENQKFKGNYHINSDDEFVCNLCSSTFQTRMSVYDHIRKHSGLKFLCHLDGKWFSSRNNLAKHHRTVHLKEKNYQCNVCQKRYDSSYRLRIHQNSHQGIRQFGCTICPRDFLTSSSLARHKKTVHSQDEPFCCNICLRKFNIAYNMKMHMATHTGIRQHICSHCNADFHRKRKLDLHMKDVHNV